MQIDQYDLICFDWDGTLVDSHNIYRKCDQFLIYNNYGKTIPIEELNDIVSGYWSKYGINGLDNYYRDWAKLFNDCVEKHIAKTEIEDLLKEIQYKDNVVKTLTELKYRHKNIKTALITGSRRSEIDLYSNDISKTGSLLKPNDFFDCIITKDDVSQCKPNPEPYQKAIEYFDMIEELDKILIIEDSMIGAISAYLSGIKNIGIMYDSHSDYERYDLKKFNKFHWDNWREFEKEMLND
jgi:beta-phosphoglucomutase-like phosphatase (HAD superfamily)